MKDSAGRSSWGHGELYEALCLLMTGVCCWIVGDRFGVFTAMHYFMLRHELTSLFMLGVIMGGALVVASVRKSLRLRRTMRERDDAACHDAAIARHDALTGLANRRMLVEAIDQRRRPGTSRPGFAVLLIDLDRFKPVNDLYGHAAGDAVLCAIADRLVALLPEHGMAARLGGDEFAVMVDLGDDRDGLIRLAQQAIAGIAVPVLWNRNELKVGCTIGIALGSGDHADAEAILHAADLAMYQAKKDGRGAVRFFETAMDADLKARARLETELRHAIETGEIEPYYQPIVTLPERTMIGIEILARWRHPRRGLLTPDEFIRVAEETGLIGDLSLRLLRQACLDARDWPAHLTMSINIAPQQFQDRFLAERLLAILTETDFPPVRLEIELTESALVQDLEATRAILTALRAQGVRIALDDFGTGYSNLYHLRELKFDKLKIDRSYVDAITMSDERATLVDAIIKLGESLGLVTTAEGIETDASLDWLAGQGCSFGQGFLFGAPMTKDDLEKLIVGGPVPVGDGLERAA